MIKPKYISASLKSIGRSVSGLPLIILLPAYQGVLQLLVKPLMTFFLQLMLITSGYQIAFNDSIMGFFTTVQGFTAAFILLSAAVLITYLEFACIILFSKEYLSGNRIRLTTIIRQAAGSIGSLIHIGLPGFCLYALVLLPLAGLGITPALLPQLEIPRFIIGELHKNTWGMPLLNLVSVILFLIFLATLFVLPAMILERQSFGQALFRSFALLKSCGKELPDFYASYLLIWALAYSLPEYILTTQFAAARISLLVLNLIRLFLTPVLLCLTTLYYLKACKKPVLLSSSSATQNRPFYQWFQAMIPHPARQKFRLDRKYRLAAAITAALLAGCSLLTLIRVPQLHSPLVIAHRGSAYGVENTFAALDGAIRSGADYAEIDIQLSADRIPVVIHDSNLKRLTGYDVNVYDLTADTLGRYTVTQNGMTGTIPTLEQVLRHCEGKIGLAVELKLHGHEQADLIDEVMKVVKNGNYRLPLMFLSLDYDLIAGLKTAYPEYEAGYCIFGSVGHLSVAIGTSLPFDFIVIEESMVTPEALADFRKSWLPVYVWTVNNPTDMEAYLNMGVLGLVSDYPDLAIAVREKHLDQTKAVYLDRKEWEE